MATVNQNQLVDILDNTDDKSITVVYESPVKMNKKDNPFYEKEGRSFVPKNNVYKRVVDTFALGLNYNDEVNRRLRDNGVETEYQSSEVAWAETVVPNKVIRHKGNGKLYLKVFRTDDTTAQREVTYMVDGHEADAEEKRIISDFSVKVSGNVRKQEDAGLGNESQVKVQTIAFDNIISVIVDDTMYELR